jgi:N-acetyl-anhydromuramoyl-L-alanine amidase
MPEAIGLWVAGWYKSARHVPSPNFGPRPSSAVVDLVVVHSISLPPGEYGNGAVEALFTNRLDWNAHPYFASIKDLRVSAHFVIDRLGQITQFVAIDQRAWHAGASVHRGREGCNDFSVGVELEGLEGSSFESAQYLSLAALCADLSAVLPIACVAGHEDIAPGRKFDPGAGFDWLNFEQQLSARTAGDSRRWDWRTSAANQARRNTSEFP